jgi:predicted TIM-barrel fold metal-dependent hydrolase
VTAPLWPQLTDVGRRLADLTALGVDIQVVSPMPMHRYWAEPELAAKLAAVTNEAVAAHCADGNGRLAGLGTIPLQHPRLAIRWLEHVMGEIGLAGVLIFDGTLDRHPGLKLLAARGGGFLPAYIGRSDHAWVRRPDARGCVHRPSEYP